MPKLASLKNLTKAASFQIGSETVNLTYYPLWETRYGPGETEAEGKLSPADYYPSSISHVVASWDVEGEDGKPVPLTADAIKAAKVPTRLLQMCEKAILEAEQLGKSASGT